MAVRHLVGQHHMQILDMSWSRTNGTLDIVAVRERVMVACVVKPRKGSLTPVRRGRMRRLAIGWVVAKSVLFDEVRVDVITVEPDDSGQPAVTEHLEGI